MLECRQLFLGVPYVRPHGVWKPCTRLDRSSQALIDMGRDDWVPRIELQGSLYRMRGTRAVDGYTAGLIE
ncbi:hypothetical protein VNO77_27510 [Canavalia gladiata]|uniref:Uncharacterized protein n=1 Tax=Canavalia gladiata TaxID=3824 RepID=A0AAN9Q481_CANGL